MAAWAFGVSPQGAVVVGGALAASSTAIVRRQLAGQHEIHSSHERKALGVLRRGRREILLAAELERAARR